MNALAHVRRLARIVSSPRDASLLVRMLAWSFSLPLLKRALPLPRLVGLMHSDTQADLRDGRREERIAALSEWVFRSRPRRSRDNCLDRALVAYRYLGGAGAEPTIVVGVARDSTAGIAGHVWVTVDGDPIHDDLATLADFATLTAFGADGRPVSTGAETQTDGPPATRSRKAPPPPAAPPR